MDKRRFAAKGIGMRVYQRKENPPFKWLLAAALFLIVLGVTWNEAEGFVISSSPGSATQNSHSGINSDNHDYSQDYGGNPRSNPPVIPPDNGGPGCGGGGTDHGDQSVIPEPTTLFLVGSGLAAGYLMRARRKQI